MRLFSVAALAALPLINAAPTELATRNGQHKTQGLNDLARKAGLLYFGTAIDNPSLNNSKYMSIATDSHIFGQVTPANGQKWMYIEPERNVFDYSMGDAIIRPAIQHGQLRRCHNLVWHSQLPDWLTGTNYTKSELISILENHIAHEVKHYYGQCYAWDVVNEALNEDGTLRSDLWLTTIGPEYLELAFEFAAKYVSPGTKLYYNDYNIETINNKSLAVVSLIKSFKKKGIRIDGVGLQSHFTAGSSPSYDQQVANMAQFTSLDVEVAITELDVRVNLPDDATKEAQQASDYANAVKACKDTDGCVGVTVWDFYDPFSWVPGVFAGQGDADLWWGNFTMKPAYYSVAEVLEE
ncbi:glycoside hydrolase family 10 protein [Glonium stellatum]|uniref:Beta-xylanase n=1 Tax=Glonium stellatum TaxID=574774 RepID=A0A8E2F9C8_9PEZI|nr:glycoside hydrolase family 10 protein [Glonium stellatum]